MGECLSQGIGSFSLELHAMNPVGDTTTLKVLVRQGRSIIAETQVADIDTDVKHVNIEFQYKDYKNPVILELRFMSGDNDNPIEIINLVIDDLFSIRKLLHQGQLLSDKDDSLLGVGNVLYGEARLVYKFPLPIYGPTKGS